MTPYESYLVRLKQMNAEAEKGSEPITFTLQKGQGNMNVTLNGVRMEGTPAQIAEVARKLGVAVDNDGVHYLSQSRGLIRIDQMSEEHLLRTIRKRLREWASGLQNKEGLELLTALSAGRNDVTTNAMVVRYQLLVSQRTGRNIISRY
jgi:hypothetical protein